ncbi:hypothetical protein PAEPH01_2340 [Pancytospora epiphaga]|nr:hypothetical protein PAEPH01_2340 [Pancytospora epiphaga]
MLPECEKTPSLCSNSYLKAPFVKVLYTGPSSTVYTLKIDNQIRVAKRYRADLIDELRTETDILSVLRHENIITLVPSNFKEMLILEYHGVDLRHALTKGKLCNINSIIHQILDGLVYLHDHFIVHCDIKPENILINGEGRVKLIDFASARKTGSKTQNLRNTICYSPLEVLLGVTSISASIDMWALGCVVYELVFDKQPFNGNNTFSVIDQILKLLGAPCVEDYTNIELCHVNFLNVFIKIEPSLKFSDAKSYGLILEGLFAFNPMKRLSASAVLGMM